MRIILKGQPISTNNCYYHGPRGQTFLKPKAKSLKMSYINQARKQYRNKQIHSGSVSLKIELHMGDLRKRDWDNYHKLSMDALNGIMWVDDSQITKVTVEKFYDKKNPRMEIEIL